MKKLESIVPALLTFGPIFMVMGLSNKPNTIGIIMAYMGALMLSLGCAYLFAQLARLRNTEDAK